MERFPNKEDLIPTFGHAVAIGVSFSWWESYYKYIGTVLVNTNLFFWVPLLRSAF